MEVTESLYAAPLELNVDELWAMRDAHEFNLDIKCHYRLLVSSVINIDYLRRFLTFSQPVYKQLGRRMYTWAGLAMPSLAYIKPSQTRELSYYCYQCACNSEQEYTDNSMGIYGAVPGDDAAIALVWMFQMLLGCPEDMSLEDGAGERFVFSDQAHAAVQRVYDEVMKNSASVQGITALDTTTGRFDAVPNFMAMMAFELHDRFYGTDYASVNPQILEFVEGTLQDPETKLFYKQFQTGSLDFEGENLDPRSFWCATELDANTNALALIFYNYFDPDAAQVAWGNFKELFTEQIMSIAPEQIATGFGTSLMTAVGKPAEALFGAIAAAGEMEDKEYYGQLSEYLFAIGMPFVTEGCTAFLGFDNEAYVATNYLAFARTHIPWKQLFEMDYQPYFDANAPEYY